MVNNIIDYWYATEYFSPCWPVDPKKDTNLTNEKLPWQKPNTNLKCRISYNLYFGKISTEKLTYWLQDSLKMYSDEYSIEKGTLNTCIFAIKVDEEGKYVPKSFAISTLVWSVCKLVSLNSLDFKFSSSDIELLQQSMDVYILEEQIKEDFTITKGYLKKLYRCICEQLDIDEQLAEYEVWSSEYRDYADKNGKFPPLNPFTELIQSFYFKDIKRVKTNITETVRQYTKALTDNQDNRVHIDCDTAQMQMWLTSDKYPLGAWPSIYNPSLMQQLGINLAISDEQNIFSVNGPPGTGKTTLLKEIVASNVIKRANIMMSYDIPDDAFKKQYFKDPIDRFQQTFYELDTELSHFGMIVASNNNATVENISTELPKQIEKDRTGRFSSKGENLYFSEIASELHGEQCWGLISAKLGKKENIKKLVNCLWWSNDNKTLKDYYDEEPYDIIKATNRWDKAKEEFKTALDAVLDERQKISNSQKLLYETDRKKEEYKSIKSIEIQKNDEYVQAGQRLENIKENLAELESRLSVEKQIYSRLKETIPTWKWILRKLIKKDDIITDLSKSDELIKGLEIEIAQLMRKCEDTRVYKNICEKELKIATEELDKQSRLLNELQQEIDSYKQYFGENWPDESFWKDILNNEKSQSSCPWITEHYDKLREELFYQALMLHKTFILNSNAVKQNLNRLFAVWDDKITGDSKNTAYSHLFNTLQLLIPVVSTTFASVQSFLDGIGPEALGMLIIDEAGQATPQSALGAIWRTKKVIVVGDPFQVEPVVTVPKALQIQFANKYEIPSAYRLPETSVQVLADNMNRFGGERTFADSKVWLGCPLVVHRRCLSPMFDISNKVAYNGRMFSKTNNPNPNKKFLLDNSIWLDCKGLEEGNRNHAVLSQIELAGQLFEKAIDVYDGFPDLYFITPFTSVANELSKVLYKLIKENMSHVDKNTANNWVRTHCGTVHTFQGKESSEVILVMGCDFGSGIGAARWVGSKPNIVNVAVSRAKYRLCVIGDYTLWRNIEYVQSICEHLTIINADDWKIKHMGTTKSGFCV